MQYWLMKSEPDVWSIEQQKKTGKKGATWDGVRNYQAANNLKKMKKGDQAFFYHSVSEKSVVGIVKVVKEYYNDPTDQTKRFVVVDVKAIKKLKKSVSLNEIKLNKKLKNIALVKQSRLSVMPIDTKSWKIINKISKVITKN